MKNKILKSLINNHMAIPMMIFGFYFIINYVFLFCLTSPSDPLQYVEPAINPNNGFPFFDRLFLWLWIRFFTIFSIAPEEIGGIATLTLTSLTLAIGVWYLIKRAGLLASAIFFFLFVMSPFTTGVSSYTYPTQLLTFVLFTTLILFDLFSELKIKSLILGFGCALAIFSKIQGVAFIFFIVYLLNTYKVFDLNRFAASIAIGIGFLLGVIAVGSIILIADGPLIFNKIFSYFASSYQNPDGKSTFLIQAAGRSEGGVPPFYQLLRQGTFFIGFISIFLCSFLRNINSPEAKLFSAAAFFQVMGLFLIYLVTQRGGPVIDNYFMDFLVLSLIPSSILISKSFRYEINEKKIAIFLFMITGALFSVFIFYSHFYVHKVRPLYFESALIFLFIIISLAYKKNIFYKIQREFSLRCLGAFLFLWVIVGGLKAVTSSLNKMAESYQYHSVSRILNSLEDTEVKIFASFTMDRPTPEDATFRLKQVYETFYKKKSISFFYDLPPPNLTFQLLTDRFDLIKLNCEFKKEIFIPSQSYSIKIMGSLFGAPDYNFKKIWFLKGCKI